MSQIKKILIAVVCIAAFATSCKKDISTSDDGAFKSVAEYDHKVIWQWNELLLQIERYAAGYRPGPISAAVGFINLAAYEAVVPGMPDYQSIAGRYNGLKIPSIQASQEYHWPTVINKVNEVFYTRMFPKLSAPSGNIQVSFNANVDKIRPLFESNEAQYKTEVSDEVILRSRNHGEAVALAVWDWWKTDAATFDQYKDPFRRDVYDWQTRTNPGRWVATDPGPGAPMFPLWGNGRTLAISDGLKICRPYEDYIGKFSEEEGTGIHNQALEVMIQQKTEIRYLSEWVGEFWSDDLLGLTFSPPIRFFAVADQIYDLEKVNLEKAMITNAKLGVATHDTGIGAWNSKYYYNLERPESYIKRVIDNNFEPMLFDPSGSQTDGISPSFPAYPSGHSTFGGSAAAVLESEFGANYGMTDFCHKDRTEFEGRPRHFESIYEMAQENAWSRVPLGVHYRIDCSEGLRYGTEIGKAANNLPWKK